MNHFTHPPANFLWTFIVLTPYVEDLRVVGHGASSKLTLPGKSGIRPPKEKWLEDTWRITPHLGSVVSSGGYKPFVPKPTVLGGLTITMGTKTTY